MGWANPKGRDHDDPYSYVLSDRADRFEDGGLAFVGIRSLQKVVDHYLELGGENIQNYILDLSEYAYQMLEAIPGIQILGRYPRETRCGLICMHLPSAWEMTNEKLEAAGIQAHMLSADILRIGIHYYNDCSDIDRLCKFFAQTAQQSSL